jgi:uncharacterized protein YbjT (DUF2867 family)
MKIVITGSLGNIGKPLTQELVQKGHLVTVISSKVERQKEIELIGANSAIGKMQDVEFLTKTFQDADIVYLMETWEGIGSLFDKSIDFKEGMREIGRNYKIAIEEAGIKNVIHLSSVGAHSDKGFGSLSVHHDIENILNQLPDDVFIKFMRPVGFYTNIFRSMQSIKMQSAIISNHGGDEKEPWVSPIDIASVIAEEIEKPFNGRAIRYIASDEISPNEVAKVLGNSIGQPDLKWLVISDEQLLNGMLDAGINPDVAKSTVETQASQRGGLLFEDFNLNKPILGKVKFLDFAKEFAMVYNK